MTRYEQLQAEQAEKRKKLNARKIGVDNLATLKDEREDVPTSIRARIDADIAKGREAEAVKQKLIAKEREDQDSAIAESATPKISDINRSAAPVDYSPEAATARERYVRDNPTAGMSTLAKLEYTAQKYNPLALSDMAVNRAGAGVAQSAAALGDAVLAPFKGGRVTYPTSQTPAKADKDELNKHVDNAINALHNANKRYYLGSNTLQNKADRYTAQLDERYARLTDTFVTRALSDLAQSTGYMVPATVTNAIMPGAGTALLFASGYASGERQAVKEGASSADAKMYALLNGLNQSAGELLIGGVLGKGAGALDGLFRKAGIDIAAKITNPKLRTLATGLTSVLGEGAEEVIQGLTDVAAQRATYNPDAAVSGKELAYEGLLGAGMGAVYGAAAGVKRLALPSVQQLAAENVQATFAERNAPQTNRAQDFYNSRIADIKSRETDLFGRLRTAEEDEIFNRLTTAKNNTEKSGILAGASDEAIATASRTAEAGKFDILFERMDRTAAGNIIDGYEYGGKLYINPESQRTVAFIQGHELTHSIEKAKSYNKLSSYVLQRMGTDAVEAERKRIGSIRTTEGQQLAPEEINREIVADWAGRNLLNNEADIVDIVRADRTLAERIKDWLSGMVKLFTGTAEEKFYARARSLYIKALAEARQNDMVRATAAASVSTDTSAPLRTLNNSKIARSAYGVGKDMAGKIYVHKDYATEIVPTDIWEKAKSIAGDFKYNTIVYNAKTPNIVRFDEAPTFDTDREPYPGNMLTVNIETGETKNGYNNQIWHHKWQWVKNSYKGFDVQESYDWSKRWLNDITNPSGIYGNWKKDLRNSGLPYDTIREGRDVAYDREHRDLGEREEFTGMKAWGDSQQTVTSAGTSINSSKTPKLLGRKKLQDEVRTLASKQGNVVIADLGGGKFDNAKVYYESTEFLNGEPYQIGKQYTKDPNNTVTFAIYDRYNRTGDYNDRTISTIRGGKADIVTINNVTNVIDSRQARAQLYLNAADAVKSGGTVYISPYVGDKSGALKYTQGGQSAQLNRVPKEYIKETERFFNYVTATADTITAREPVKDATQIKYSVSDAKPNTRKDTNASPDAIAAKEARRAIKELEAQNEKLRTVNEYQRKQFKRSDKNEPNAKAVARYVKGLIKSYSSKTPVDAVAQKLTDLYTYFATGDENGAPVWDVMYDKARDIAGDIIGGSEALVNGDALETFSEIKKYFKGKKFYVPADKKSDFGDYQEFRRKNFGHFLLTTDPASGAKGVDIYYGELTELFGEGYFPSEITNPADQLQHISHVMDGMNAIYGNPFSGQAFDEVTAIVASDMLDKFYDIPQANPTFADKAAKDVTLAKVKGQAKLDALRERKDAQIQKTRQDLRESAAKKLADLRQKNDERIAKLKADIRERAARARTSRSNASLRNRIRKGCQRMVKMLAKPDKNRHIPDELQQNVAELFGMIAKSPDEIIKTGDMAGTPRSDSLKNRIGKVSDLYRRILAENNAPVTLDPDMQAMFDQAAQALETTPFGKLDAEQLDNLYKLTRAIYKSITTANKAFRDAQSRTYDDLAEAVRVDNAGKKERTPFAGNALIRGAKKVTDDLINFSVIDPRRFFKRLGKTMETLYLNIEHGQDKYIETVTKTVEFMKKTLDGIDTTKWDGDGADRIKVGIVIDEFAGTTKEVEFTPAMLIDLYLANKREQSRKHLYGIGGIALQPPGTDKPTKPLKINEQQINDILDKHMAPEMTRVANAMSEYLTKEMGALANEVSQEMYEYSKFTETNYWPIDVHRGSVTKSFGEVKGDPTLENSGATKTLMEHAKNALVIKSALDVFDKHSLWAAAYNAYVPALADMRHVLNVKDADGTTIASLLNDKFGERTEKYINNFMNHVNSGKLSHGLWNDKISKKLLRNFKAASVGMNLSVVIKQPVSYIRAADVINPKYLIKALKLESRKTRRANMAEMLKHNPIARIKDWGFADMGFGKNQRQLYDKSAMALSDKVSEASGFLPSQADKITWARIWQAVKLEQQAKGVMDVARWAERFREVISSTQVVNTIFTTPPILNEDSTLTRMATAFMAEPLKSFNMLHDAISSKNAAQIRRTAATLITNTFAIAIIDTAFKHLRQKEDEEDTTLLSLSGEVLLNMVEDVFSMLPYVRDMISILQGYNVERADLTGIDKLWKALSSTGNDIAATVTGGEPRGTVLSHLKDVVAGVSVVTGIAAGNIWRDVESVLRSFAQNTNNAGMEYLITATLYNPENESNRRYYYDMLYKYRNDDKVYEALKNRLIGEHGYKAENIEAASQSRWKKSGEHKSAYESEAARVMPSVEGNPHILELPKAERESLTEQAGTYAAAVARDRLDSDYELNASAKKIKSAVEDGLSVGEYLLYTNARKKADEALDDNGSYGVKEKVRAIRDLSWLNVSKQQALLILDTRTKDNPEGLANEIEAILGSGLSFDEFLNVYERHNEIYNEEDLSASAQALKYANWLDGRYTAEQSDTIQEYFDYWSGAKAVPTNYNKFTDAGMDIDTAYDLADSISKLEPMEGKKAVSTLQRYRVIADAEISDKDKLRAMSVLMSETGYKALAKARLKGLKIDSYVQYLEGTADIVSDIKNGESVSGSRKQKVLTLIDRMILTKAQKDLLYDIEGYSAGTIDDAPWHGGERYDGDIHQRKVNGRQLRPLS